MIFELSHFYKRYLSDYHRLKVTACRAMLDDIEKYSATFFGNLQDDQKNQFKKMLQADIRQTYFHAIETFFELLFALNPLDQDFIGDTNIMVALTHSDFKNSYKRIQNIAIDDKALDFLDDDVTFQTVQTAVGHYIFYFGIREADKEHGIPGDKLKLSLNAIRHAIKLLAIDFADRAEYNAYKHGLRLIPALANISIQEAETGKSIINADVTDSMSFFTRTNLDNKIQIVTKLFDTKRDAEMTILCSNLIKNIIYYRRIFLTDYKPDKVEIVLFDKEAVEKCSSRNVGVQSFTYTLTKNDHFGMPGV